MKKRKISSCSVIFTIAVIAAAVYSIYKIIRFFQSPGALEKIKELLQGVGLCIGFALLVLICFYIYSYVTSILPPPRFRRKGKEYRVRVYPSEIDALSDGSIPYYRTEPINQGPVLPVYCVVSMTNYGLSLAVLPPDYSWDIIPQDNARRFDRISENHSGVIIVPMESINLYYLIVKKMGVLTIEQTPVKLHGYSGSLKFGPETEQIQVVIILTSILEPENLFKPIKRTKPIKIKMEALDETGQYDPADTRELYNAVYKDKSAQVERDDDSWMYQSRPTIGWW